MKNFFPLILVLSIALQVHAAPWPPSVENEQLFSRNSAAVGDFSQWTELWSGKMNRPLTAWGPPVSMRGLTSEQMLESVLRSAHSSAHFEHSYSHQTGTLTRYFFRELHAGVDVVSGRADLVLNDRGELMRWTVRAHDMLPVSGDFVLDESTCRDQLTPARSGEYNTITSSSRVYFPDWTIRALLPAYRISISGARSDQRWEGIIDANSGAIIMEWSGIATDNLSGVVTGPYWPEYLEEPLQLSVYPHESVYIDSNLVTTNALGEFSREAGQSARVSARLRGPYVFVENEDAPAGDLVREVSAPFAPLSMEWAWPAATPPEFNLYHHTVLMHDWYKILDPEYTAMDYPVPAVANVGGGYDNAYWNGYGTYYGSGSSYSNFAMFSDVIYHEYTHGVTDGIYPEGMLPYIDQPGALNEAWSDYFACTINEDPLMAERMQGNNPHSWFRNLENDMVFPQDWRGEVHGDSPFISGSLWIIRQELGAAFADSLAHFARYGLAETFLDYLISCLETDDNDGDLSNGTPHGTYIYDAFGFHGIGPGNDPDFVIQNVQYFADGSAESSGDGDRFMEQGETVALTFHLLNGAILFPPPAENVTITVTSTDENIHIPDGTRSITQLLPGQTSAVGPVHIQLNANSADRWLSLNIHVSCANSPATVDYPLEFTIGTPRILLVADDATSNVEHFVSDAMRAQNRIFEKVELSTGTELSNAYLPNYGLIIWLSGNESGNILTASDRDILRTYMEAGNKIVLSGQDIVDDLSATDFYQYQLQVQLMSDSVLSNTVTADALPLPDNSWYLVTGSRGASNQRRPSSFEPYGSSRAVAHYGRGESGPGAVIEFMNGQGLLFGFGIEAVSGMAPGSSSLDLLLQSIYTWAGELLPVSEPESTKPLPNQFAIHSAYPNPFNSTVQISYSLPLNQSGTLEIFDIAGRQIATLALPEHSTAISWSPENSSGVYFARVAHNQVSTPAIKLLYLR